MVGAYGESAFSKVGTQENYGPDYRQTLFLCGVVSMICVISSRGQYPIDPTVFSSCFC